MSSPLVVQDLMETEYVTLTPDMPITEAVSILVEQKVTGAPVLDEDGTVIGLLSEKQCLGSLLSGAYDRMPAGIVSEFMLEEFVTVPPDMAVFDLAKLFVSEVLRRFLVVDDGVLVEELREHRRRQVVAIRQRQIRPGLE